MTDEVRPHALGPTERAQGVAPSMSPLANYKVLDIGVLFAGPLVATMLGDLGADVVKVEHPLTGDPLRKLGWVAPPSDDGLWWKIVSRNKRCVSADLSTADGQDLVRALAANADVLVESFRPGVLEKWNLDPAVLIEANPRLVVVRISGFGQSGPYSHRPGFGTLAEAMSGLAFMTGWPDRPPTLPPFGLGDAVAALTATVGVTAALIDRDTRSGRGQVIDVALTDALLAILGPQAAVYTKLGIEQVRSGNSTPFSAPRGAYLCADGQWLALSGSTDQIARRLFDCLGRPELAHDPRYATNQARLERETELDELIGRWTASRTRDEALAAFHAAGVAAGPVYSIRNILEDEHFQSRHSFVTVPDEELGDITMPNIPLRFSRTPGEIRHAGRSRGEDHGDVLRDWHIATDRRSEQS